MNLMFGLTNLTKLRMKNIVDVKKALKICNENNLSFEELFFCYLLLFNSENRQSEFNLEFKVYYENNKMIHNYKTDIIDALVEAGFIINHNKVNQKIRLDKILITDKAKQLLFGDDKFITIDVAWQEVMNAYPKFMSINGKRINARTTDNITKLQEHYYNNVIKGSYKLHREFIELTLVKFGEHDRKSGYCDDEVLADTGLQKYIHSWESNKEIIIDYLQNGSDKTKPKFIY